MREQDSSTFRTLTEPLKKRARLALVCAKKVMPIWCKCDSEDKRPQDLIKKSFAYLDGEIAAEAAVAAWKAVIVALLEEETEENFLWMRKGDLKWQNFRKECWIH